MTTSPDLGTPDDAVVEPEPTGATPQQPAPLRPLDVIKTYRYLRLGMIGAVVLLAASILIERGKVDCWQTSISAYYYTPVRAIFVGSMMAVGLSLIVYKGRSPGEDPFLNFAGMLAPVVAIVPTTNVGTCWSIQPEPLPLEPDGTPAGWVVANIRNNFDALLVAGVVGLVTAAIIALVVNRGDLMGAAREQFWTVLSLAATAVILVVAWWLSRHWSGFDTDAHSVAAIGMFVLLIGAVAAVAWDARNRGPGWFWTYVAVAVLMAAGGALIYFTQVFGDHTTFALEAYEILLFAVYWAVQTWEKWPEEVTPNS